MLQSKTPTISLFSTAYLPPISYFQYMKKAKEVFVEQYESYQKQSYRTRCHIISANGVMPLSIPVVKDNRALIRDIRISEHSDWQTQHWRSIESAYNSSPFFEYYADDLYPFFKKKWLFLWDFNMEVLYKVLELLDLEININFTDHFHSTNSHDFLDVRDEIHPKKELILPQKKYYQVFEQKHGFIPDMSIIDLLFNMGNESQLII